MSVFRSSGPGPKDRRKLWEDFRNDLTTLAVLRVTPDEVERLHTVFMISKMTERHELIAALSRLRYGSRP
jgi:hypothetical protein